jgi:hypothetical protein
VDILGLADTAIAKAEATRSLSLRDPARWTEIELDHVAMLDTLRQMREHYAGHIQACRQLTEAATNLSGLYYEKAPSEWLLKPKAASHFRRALFTLLTLLRDA